jgi:hypothetical protein
MRKTMILGAALAALLISVLPAEAGCEPGCSAGCGRGVPPEQAAMSAADGGCYSSQYAAAAFRLLHRRYAPPPARPGTAQTGYAAPSYYSYPPRPRARPGTARKPPPTPRRRAIQYVYTTAPAPAPAPSPRP